MRPVRTVARTLLSTIFVVSGARAVANPGPHLDRAKTVTDRVAPVLRGVHPGIPTDPTSMVRANGAAQVVGGLLLATGHLTRPAAALLAGTLVPTTIAGHPFWNHDDPAERRLHQVQFMKNLGLFGGLLLAMADTQGRPGLGWRTSHAVDDGRRRVRRAVRTARRDARIAVRSAAAARRFPG
ncbi:DoxX family protein [Plantactinospora soyae]|uniref:Membrane protein YphA (DoxX/SURF4 family) n=1 Tax=Plantactinospora soyae TaxID=1544732 RepID=A0A927M1S6_9ACTN|nr:DoxX family protein [Plantactinospora soyae]MBE1486049.1 putative membrane protein YphA (DoxX/SURF4 family) [Plantactinospora soyae]